MVYQYSTHTFPIPAQDAGEALEKIEKKHGELTKEIVLEEARKKSHVLHSCFEWDSAVAAEKYRLTQAGMLIRSVTIVIEEEEAEDREVRAFVNVAESKMGRFMNVRSALAEPDTRDIVLERAKRELEAFKRKYENLLELSALINEIDKILAA